MAKDIHVTNMHPIAYTSNMYTYLIHCMRECILAWHDELWFEVYFAAGQAIRVFAMVVKLINPNSKAK